jgi:uncharacterized protein (UPF0332 family)
MVHSEYQSRRNSGVSKDIWLTKAERCLESAQTLLDIGDSSGASNRAYYAMFNSVRAALIAVGQDQLSRSKTHAGVISAFGLFLVKAGHIDPAVAKYLGQEAHLRLVADYEGTEIPLEDAKVAFTQAQAFVQAIRLFVERKA